MKPTRPPAWRAWAGLASFLCSFHAHAALSITPPQLAPDENGIIATEVKSSVEMPTRWSVRIIAWNPLEAAPPTASASNVSAIAESSASLGVDISPRFFSLAGSGRQVIRARILDRSKHYRLLIEQIPLEVITSQGVNFRFRFSLPVYRSRHDPLIPPGIIIQ